MNDHLNDLSFELKPFQLEGFNYLKDLEANIVNWSTGTGKTLIGIATANYLYRSGKVDKVIVASRNHNKINWQRQFKKIANLDAVVVEVNKGDAVARRKARTELYTDNSILIINYEKFRLHGKLGGDGDELKKILKGKNVYFIFDEMPVMLKNTTSLIYRGALSVTKACKKSHKTMLSATPLENSPEDIFACMKILDSSIFGTSVADFRDEYGLIRNIFAPTKVEVWDASKLPEIGQKLSHMMHRADKYKDPDIAAQFPKEQWEDVIIDMSDEDRKLYNFVLDDILKNFSSTSEALSQMIILQLICDNPALVNKANGDLAAKILQKKTFADTHSAKLEKLKTLIEETPGKIVLFNMYNDLGSQELFKYVKRWGYGAVLFDGSMKAKQEAEDRFRNDDDVKIFVSSDKGSDSINLEKGSVVINYNLPYKYTTLIQRVNRVNRLTSQHENVYYYNLLIADSIEDRKLEIIQRKKDLQDAIFNSESTDLSSDFSKSDLMYMLTGNSDGF